MKILITGSNGLLGQKLLQRLNQKSEHETLATSLGRDRTVMDAKNYHYLPLDITNGGHVHDVLSDFKPDVVINTAAMTQVDACENNHSACWNLNVIAVKNLVAACQKTSSYLIHLSTDFIFDGQNGPYSEEDVPNPISYYGKSKLESEYVVKESGIESSILRTVLVYGYAPGLSRSNIVLWVKHSLEEQRPIKVVTDQWRTPTLAEDLARGCMLAAEKRIPGIFNISGEEMMTPYDIALSVARSFGLGKEWITAVDGSMFSQPAKRPPKTGFVLEKAKKILGYHPTSFTKGLELIKRQLSDH